MSTVTEITAQQKKIEEQRQKLIADMNATENELNKRLEQARKLATDTEKELKMIQEQKAKLAA